VEINFSFSEDGSTHGVSILRREIVILALDRWGNQGESEVRIKKSPLPNVTRAGK
jgi:hypothetical protein